MNTSKLENSLNEDEILPKGKRSGKDSLLRSFEMVGGGLLEDMSETEEVVKAERTGAILEELVEDVGADVEVGLVSDSVGGLVGDFGKRMKDVVV